jgi:hypothetical protein
MDITTTRDKEKGSGYISYWNHDGCSGKARSRISPEQAEKNAIRQAINAGCRMVDYNGQPQGHSITRNLF